jgi:hypothetical protein
MQLEWLKLLKYLSAAYYAFEGMSMVEFQGQQVRAALASSCTTGGVLRQAGGQAGGQAGRPQAAAAGPTAAGWAAARRLKTLSAQVPAVRPALLAGPQALPSVGPRALSQAPPLLPRSPRLPG